MLCQRVFIFILLSSLITVSHAATKNSQLVEKFAEAEKLTLLGKNKKAISSYQAIIRLNSQHPEAYNNLAALYLKEKNPEQAKLTLEQGLKAHNGYGALYKSLTAINVAMAREAYSKALQIKLNPLDVKIETLAYKDEDLLPTRAKPASAIDTGTDADNSLPHPSVLSVVQTEKTDETIESILHAWAAAWSAQAVDMYLSFYHSDYSPAGGVTRKDWQRTRSSRLKKPKWIKINLSNIQIKNKSDNRVEVIFKQAYQSDRHRDKSTKKLVLLYTDIGWRIFSEKNI